MSSSQILQGDCRDRLRELGERCVDAIVTDPPYGLAFMGKRWDYNVPGVDVWLECLRVLKPGGRLIAFSGARTSHRMVCAIEDAGFVVEDTLMWLYGSGFPKHRSKLKPGYEPIVLARKGPSVELNIDDCRIPVSDASYARNHSGDRGHSGTRAPVNAGLRVGGGSAHDAGRWPANVLLDEDAAALLDEQSGELVSGANPTRRGPPNTRNTYGEFVGQPECVAARGVDRGGASRFFYCAKASRTERNAGLDGMPEEMLAWSSGEKSPGTFQSEDTNRLAANHHPTVKPIDLMRWLVRLVTPRGGIVLDPFAGSGSTGIACALEGFSFIGCELDPAYVEIAQRRISHHTPAPLPLFAEVAE